MPRLAKYSEYLQIGVRCTREEMEAARRLGNGNISAGVRFAIRLASKRELKPLSLYLTLRAAAEMARDLENRS